jgi:hypothetical protein
MRSNSPLHADIDGQSARGISVKVAAGYVTAAHSALKAILRRREPECKPRRGRKKLLLRIRPQLEIIRREFRVQAQTAPFQIGCGDGLGLRLALDVGALAPTTARRMQ